MNEETQKQTVTIELLDAIENLADYVGNHIEEGEDEVVDEDIRAVFEWTSRERQNLQDVTRD